MKTYHILFILILLTSCTGKKSINPSAEADSIFSIDQTSIVVLGTIQDAGSPQMGCTKDCCKDLFDNPDPNRKITSLGLIDAGNDKTYLFDASPDIVTQMKWLTQYEPKSKKEIVDGIFLTHAHTGHYSGLMYFGKESIDAKGLPVFVMPRMKDYLSNNGPWSQLVNRQNIILNTMVAEEPVKLSNSIEVIPFLVTHRDEYSETVGYKIKGPNKTALFIPDINKWRVWEKDIKEEIKKVDYAFLDATFYSGLEMNTRDISQIPHPFVIESLEHFKNLSVEDKNKIIFIHFNHTNPALDPLSEATRSIIHNGFKIAKTHDVYTL
ncbi:MBL fold metallo-hydrolase [Formosa algae]|uniref:Pyrroloquinoline quinone biosynthesis protein B n=1 Tax=Formosa algae TaxID=225843 RepID=A0A9X0YPN2_9FLAO|nr:MBL fold metallo-hydrolase [Formosa algae]MBP1840713.1 pyrroloquinoline quinone biosynthesis protein B [Formosa algae]MDQ0335874.1 pyrroloquinoline quinone biosynthesis protein B [Formosa algae]OEI81225.1 pyrroloquinoline quinone biosynthesis protein PqqB [Formosa algae]